MCTSFGLSFLTSLITHNTSSDLVIHRLIAVTAAHRERFIVSVLVSVLQWPKESWKLIIVLCDDYPETTLRWAHHSGLRHNAVSHNRLTVHHGDVASQRCSAPWSWCKEPNWQPFPIPPYPPCDSRLRVSIICWGEPGDGSVAPLFPSQGTSDIMGIPFMPGQDDPKVDISQRGGNRGWWVRFPLGCHGAG